MVVKYKGKVVFDRKGGNGFLEESNEAAFLLRLNREVEADS